MYERSTAFADEFVENGLLIGSELGEIARGRDAIGQLMASSTRFPRAILGLGTRSTPELKGRLPGSSLRVSRWRNWGASRRGHRTGWLACLNEKTVNGAGSFFPGLNQNLERLLRSNALALFHRRFRAAKQMNKRDVKRPLRGR